MVMVRYRKDELPPMSEKRKAELRELDKRPASEIDLSDMPELDEDFLNNAMIGRFYKPIKKHASLRIDADVLAWFRSKGKGYQVYVNAALREAMLRELKQEKQEATLTTS